ncbi:unnamed protein product [Notodromas monacha]|uniref:Uncharacterized protein n=1 Tax=Notodromas monacha TaxID=399045 RepID=A0A7R9BPA4_9CRUS|nr:unnamed protein product [Notodromas monacha]CAG0918311.1 unnamed protein product [Notodromas monacha]
MLSQTVSCRLVIKEFDDFPTFLSSYNARKCRPSIQTCAPDWPEDDPQNAALGCSLYSMYTSVRSQMVPSASFRNVHCAVCNGMVFNQSNFECRQDSFSRSGHHFRGFSNLPSYAVIFDFSGDGGVGMAEKCKGNQEIWDDVHQRCHAITSGVDFGGLLPEFAPQYAQHLCWFNNRKGLALLFVLPVGAVMLENMVLFALSAFGIYKQQEASKFAAKTVRQPSKATSSAKKPPAATQNRKNQIRLILYLKLALIMGLGWTLGFVAGLADVPWLWYAFFFLNGLQGVLIFLAFDAKRKIARLIIETITGHQQPVPKLSKDATKTSTLSATSNRRPTNQSLSRMSEVELMVMKKTSETPTAVAKVKPTSRNPSSSRKPSKTLSFHEGNEVMMRREPQDASRKLSRPDSFPVDIESLSAKLMRQKAREILAAKLAELEEQKSINHQFMASQTPAFDNRKSSGIITEGPTIRQEFEKVKEHASKSLEPSPRNLQRKKEVLVTMKGNSEGKNSPRIIHASRRRELSSLPTKKSMSMNSLPT